MLLFDELISKILRLQEIINQFGIRFFGYKCTELVDKANRLICKAEFSTSTPTFYAKQRCIRRSYFEIITFRNANVGFVVNLIVKTNIFCGNVNDTVRSVKIFFCFDFFVNAIASKKRCNITKTNPLPAVRKRIRLLVFRNHWRASNVRNLFTTP